MTDEAIDGVPAGLSYVVNYNEDTWLGLPEDRKEYCREVWMAKAKGLNCSVIALRLHPDELFPTTEHELPYIAWKTNIELATPDGFTFDVRVEVQVETDYKYIQPVERSRIFAKLRSFPPGTRFVLTNRNESVIEAGVI